MNVFHSRRRRKWKRWPEECSGHSGLRGPVHIQVERRKMPRASGCRSLLVVASCWGPRANTSRWGPNAPVPASLVWQATSWVSRWYTAAQIQGAYTRGSQRSAKTACQDTRIVYTAYSPSVIRHRSSLFLCWGPGRSPVVPPVGSQSTFPGPWGQGFWRLPGDPGSLAQRRPKSQYVTGGGCP